MRKLFNQKFKCNTYEVFAGEYYATSEKNVVLVTLLGSCVAVCLFDEVNKVVGMNHFMLPGRFEQNKPIPVNDPKYGTSAIDMLLKDMLKAGAQRKSLQAKVFGAGNVVESFSTDVASSNAKFIKKYLSALKIPIVAEDLGGNCARKLYFFSDSKDVYLKRIKDFNSNTGAVESERIR